MQPIDQDVYGKVQDLMTQNAWVCVLCVAMQSAISAGSYDPECIGVRVVCHAEL